MKYCMIRYVAIAIISLMIMSLSLDPAMAGQGDLHLKARVVCTGPELTVGDVLTDCTNSDLAAIVIMRSPEPGESHRVSRNRLERMLMAKGWRGRLSGAEYVELGCPGVQLDLTALREPVEIRIGELLEEIGYRLSSVTDWPSSMVLSSSNLRWTVSIEKEPQGRSAIARLDLEDRAGFNTHCRLRLTCSQPRQVPVGGANLKPGDALNLWTFQERDCLLLDGRPLTAVELQGAVAKRYLKPGDVLTNRNTKPAPLVHRGREVTIRLQRGAVSICMTGIAQRDAALGDIVSVRHLDTKTMRRYRVTGQNTVAPTYLETTGENS
ncbi:MAG: flagellar basal body P-ring formation protein FlgA [bacterium]|nr:flagellar basal body P-ring formation protein FlgA [bacterium]